MPRLSKKQIVLRERAKKARRMHRPGPSADNNAPHMSASADDNAPWPSTSADQLSTSREGDYFASIANDVENLVIDDKEVQHTLEIREKLIATESMPQPKRKMVEDSGSRMSLLHDETLIELFDEYSRPCHKCMRKLQLKLEKRSGNSIMVVSCVGCDFVHKFPPKTLDKGEEFSEANMNAVYQSIEDGRGFAGYQKVCAINNNDPMTKHKYSKIKDHIGDLCFDMFRNKSDLIYQCLVAHYATLNRFPDDNGVLNIDVSFDGSWPTRGHKSHIGVGAVIDVYTGFVIDYYVCSSYCAFCNRQKTKKSENQISEEQFRILMDDHQNDCNQNFDDEASSGAMEAEVANVLWGRSLAHRFRYVNFIGDGDSNACDKVCSMNDDKGPYADDNIKVEKQECIDHVGQRFGAKLRKAVDEPFVWAVDKNGKQYKKKLLSGKHTLTDTVIKRMSYYYSVAVRRCIGKAVSELKHGIMAIFYHCGSTDASLNHQLCPKGPDSYCFYNKALANKTKPTHEEMQIYFRLDAEERKIVLNVLRDMCSDDLLRKCLLGKTQNPNEALHSKIWNKLLKTRFYGLRTVQQSLCLTLLQHNWGYLESCPLHNFGFGEIASSTVMHLERRDQERKRRSLSSLKGGPTAKRKRSDVEEGPDYSAGAH